MTVHGEGRAASDHPAPHHDDTAKSSHGGRHALITTRAVDWYRTYEFVQPLIRMLGPLPWPGTATWCELSNHDPRKLGAMLVAGVLWTLNESARQDANCQASQIISGACDWGAVARRIRQRHGYIGRSA
jgi:hypothetical protein